MRSKCTNQDASVLMQAALMPLAGVKRIISRSGARVVVKFNKVEEALKPLTGGLNSGHLQFEEKDNRVQLAAPVKISHSFASGVTSISALLARGTSLGGECDGRGRYQNSSTAWSKSPPWHYSHTWLPPTAWISASIRELADLC